MNLKHMIMSLKCVAEAVNFRLKVESFTAERNCVRFIWQNVERVYVWGRFIRLIIVLV